MTNPGDAVGTNGAYGGRTSVNATNDILSAFKGRGILNGWRAEPGGGMVVNLGGSPLTRDVAIVENDLGQLTTLNNISTQPVPVLLDAAPNLGSRIDLIVGYVNNPPDAVQTNPIQIDNPSVCGLIAVQSNVSNNPAVPTEEMIRAAITADGAAGSTAYYVVLATVTVGTGITTITASAITQGDMANLGATAIADGSVTTQKLANEAVTGSKIAGATITSSNMDFSTFSWGPNARNIMDLDAVHESGLYAVPPNTSGTYPTGANKGLWYLLLILRLDGSWANEYMVQIGSTPAYKRGLSNGKWSNWIAA